MSITTKEIARLCGVSRGTVDRALNNRPGISPETGEHIRRMAEELGYRPHQLARGLVKGKTYSIGVVVFDLYNTFFAQLLNAISERAREMGYFVYITLTDKNPQQEKDCIDHLVNGRVDGLVLCPVHQGGDYVEYLKDTGIPILTVMNTLENSGFPHVGIDDYQKMADVTKFVLSRGYTRIAYLAPPLSQEGKSNIYCQKRRYEGFADTMVEAGSAIEHQVFTSRNYGDIVRYLAEGQPGKNMVICSSDVFSLEIMDYLKRHDVKIPQDIGVMGFDNNENIRFVEPPLTTVSIPIREIGRCAAQQLITLLETGEVPPERTFFDCEMVSGETVR